MPGRKFVGRRPPRSVTLDAMSLWPVQPLDPPTASDGDLAGLHALEVALEAEALPGEPVAPLEHSVARYRHVLPFRVRKGWVVRHGGAGGGPPAARRGRALPRGPPARLPGAHESHEHGPARSAGMGR